MASDTRELESITVERTDGVVTITLRRPEKKNAADAAMWNELLDEFRSIAFEPGRPGGRTHRGRRQLLLGSRPLAGRLRR